MGGWAKHEEKDVLLLCSQGRLVENIRSYAKPNPNLCKDRCLLILPAGIRRQIDLVPSDSADMRFFIRRSKALKKQKSTTSLSCTVTTNTNSQPLSLAQLQQTLTHNLPLLHSYNKH